jgi:hypothetical protein
MPTVELDDDEWQKVMAIISQAPWNVANPLLMKMGQQLRMAGSAKTALDRIQEERRTKTNT